MDAAVGLIANNLSAAEQTLLHVIVTIQVGEFVRDGGTEGWRDGWGTSDLPLSDSFAESLKGKSLSDSFAESLKGKSLDGMGNNFPG